jgi:hypothetical protein
MFRVSLQKGQFWVSGQNFPPFKLANIYQKVRYFMLILKLSTYLSGIMHP